MLARVSNVEAFRQWRENDDQEPEDLIRWLTVDQPTEAMQAGTAFHKALELAEPGQFEKLEALGFTFLMPDDVAIEMPRIRELRGYDEYPGITITGQVDCLDGLRVDDHKTTSRFDPDRYLAGYSWRLYLRMFGAKRFRWNVFEIRNLKERTYDVRATHRLEAFAYPGMSHDCEQLVADFREFLNRYMPDYNAMREAA